MSGQEVPQNRFTRRLIASRISRRQNGRKLRGDEIQYVRAQFAASLPKTMPFVRPAE